MRPNIIVGAGDGEGGGWVMRSRKLWVQISEDDWDRLLALAGEERRTYKEQAAWLLHLAVKAQQMRGDGQSAYALERAAQWVEHSDPARFRERIQAQRFTEAVEAALDGDGERE